MFGEYWESDLIISDLDHKPPTVLGFPRFFFYGYWGGKAFEAAGRPWPELSPIKTRPVEFLNNQKAPRGKTQFSGGSLHINTPHSKHQYWCFTLLVMRDWKLSHTDKFKPFVFGSLQMNVLPKEKVWAEFIRVAWHITHKLVFVEIFRFSNKVATTTKKEKKELPQPIW